VPRETFKARARYNDEVKRERERTSSSSSSKARSVFLSPLFKTTPFLNKTKRAKKKETYRCEQRGGGGRSDGRLGELFRQVGRLDDRLVDRTVVVLMMTKRIKKTREVSMRIKTSRAEDAIIDFPSAISPKEESVLYKTKKRTIVIQRVTPSREDQTHVPFGGNLVYGNLLAS